MKREKFEKEESKGNKNPKVSRQTMKTKNVIGMDGKWYRIATVCTAVKYPENSEVSEKERVANEAWLIRDALEKAGALELVERPSIGTGEQRREFFVKVLIPIDLPPQTIIVPIEDDE